MKTNILLLIVLALFTIPLYASPTPDAPSKQYCIVGIGQAQIISESGPPAPVQGNPSVLQFVEARTGKHFYAWFACGAKTDASVPILCSRQNVVPCTAESDQSENFPLPNREGNRACAVSSEIGNLDCYG